MSPSKIDAALARGGLRLLSRDDGSMPESQLLVACGSTAPRGGLRQRILELVRQGLLERKVRGKGARVSIREGQGLALLEWVRRNLNPRTRIQGGDLLAVLALVAVPVKRSQEAPKVFPPPSPEDELYATIVRLCRESEDGGMVKLSRLVQKMGVSEISDLARSLDKLERARAIHLDPLSDPRVVPEEERSQGIVDSYRGLLFYVSLPADSGRGA